MVAATLYQWIEGLGIVGMVGLVCSLLTHIMEKKIDEDMTGFKTTRVKLGKGKTFIVN